MSQSHVIIESSDAWLLDSALPAVRRHGVVYGPHDAALATQEVAVVLHEHREQEPATTLLPVLRLPQRQSVAITATQRQAATEDEDLPTVVMPALSMTQAEPATAVLPIPPTGSLHSATPTQRRLEPCHYCYQCGAVLPPWREMCFAHEAHYGRGLPPPATMAALPDGPVDLRPTLPLPIVTRRQRAG